MPFSFNVMVREGGDGVKKNVLCDPCLLFRENIFVIATIA